MFESVFEKRQPSVKQQPPEEPSDFSRFFGPGMRSEPINIEEEQARQAAIPEPVEQPFRQPGEFTKRFGPSADRAEEPVTSLEADWNSTSTVFGSRPKREKPQPESDSVTGEKRPPGAYTLVVRTPTDEEKPANFNQAPVVQAKRRDVAPLIIAAVLLVATITLVLVMVFRGD
jgi:hypothetical protein